MRELQKKYADDREKLGQETMKLYKEEGVNPMASCFPILLQMPIFFALFNVLNNAATGAAPVAGSVLSHEMTQSLAHANFFGATLADRFWPLTNGWGGITQTVAAIMIVLMVVTQFFAQYQLMSKNMPAESQTGPMAQQQKIMLYAMPLVFGVGGGELPARCAAVLEHQQPLVDVPAVLHHPAESDPPGRRRTWPGRSACAPRATIPATTSRGGRRSRASRW